MQVIEKVKVVPEGYNGAGMNYVGNSDPLLYPIDNFNFDIPFIGGGNISKGIISLEVP